MGCLSFTAGAVVVLGVLIAIFPPPDVLSGLNSNHDHGAFDVCDVCCACVGEVAAFGSFKLLADDV